MDQATSSERNSKVYGLYSTNDSRIRYIGVTSQPIGKRINEHLRDVSRIKVNTHKKYWISSIVSKNEKILYDIIEDNLTFEEALIKEICYIKLFKSFGANLVNGTLGGDGTRFTPEVKLKISQNRKPYICSEATKERLRTVNLGRKLSEQTKLKMSESQKRIGNKPIITVEILKNRSNRMKGISSNMKGKKHSLETKEKISKARSGIPSKKMTPIFQYDINMNLIKCHKSITGASIDTNINNIYRCAIGKRKTAGGFIWKFHNI